MTTIEWKGEMAFEASTPSNHKVLMDSAKEFGGGDSAARPTEILIAALGGCTGMDVVSILTKKQMKPDSFRMEIQSERRAEYPMAFTKIVIKYILKGAKLTDEGVSRAIELSQEEYCSVAATLRGAAGIEYSYVIES